MKTMKLLCGLFSAMEYWIELVPIRALTRTLVIKDSRALYWFVMLLKRAA